MLTGSSTHPSLVLSHFSTSSFYFLAWSLKQASYTSPVSVCFLGIKSSLGWVLLPPGFSHVVSSDPDILHLILTCPSRICVKIISSPRLLWPSLSPNAEGSCSGFHSHNADNTCQLEAPKEERWHSYPSPHAQYYTRWHDTCFKNICGMNEIILEMVKKLPCKEPNNL